MIQKEKVYTEDMAEDFAIAQYEAMINRKKKGLLVRVIKDCESKGLATVEEQLRYLISHPSAKLYFFELSHEETVKVWENGVNEFKHTLGDKNTVTDREVSKLNMKKMF